MNYFDDACIAQEWNALIAWGVATDDELRLITDINGYNEESMFDVLYARTGYRDFHEYYEEMIR